MIPSLSWPEVIGHLETIEILPVHLYAEGALRPLTDLRRRGIRICAHAGMHEHAALTTDATATLWRATEQMAIGNRTDTAYALIDDRLAPITELWVLRPPAAPASPKVVALVCALHHGSAG